MSKKESKIEEFNNKLQALFEEAQEAGIIDGCLCLVCKRAGEDAEKDLEDDAQPTYKIYGHSYYTPYQYAIMLKEAMEKDRYLRTPTLLALVMLQEKDDKLLRAIDEKVKKMRKEKEHETLNVMKDIMNNKH